MKNKTQILVIHGGMTFKSKKDYSIFLETRKILIEEIPSWSDEYLINGHSNKRNSLITMSTSIH